MTRHTPLTHGFLRVVQGTGPAQPMRPEPLDLPAAPRLSVSELAAEMAELFALALMSECHLDDLDNPHCTVRINGATRFNLHELLCEMRSLPWCDAAAPLPDLAGAASPPAAERRAIRWNGQAQMTLKTLLRSGVRRPDGAGMRLSGLFATDHPVGPAKGPLPAPAASAQLSEWSQWCAAHSGAGLALPGRGAAGAQITTLAQLARHVFDAPPARAFHCATLASLAHGTPFDEGLAPVPGTPGRWTGGRLFALMAQAEEQARWAALRRLAQADRLTRPGVTAARMTVYLAREERQEHMPDARYRHAADMLARHSANLLGWVSHANAAARGPQRFDQSLFLPLGSCSGSVYPSDAAAHVVVAGALATLMKAVFDTSRPRHLRLAGKSAAPMDLADELDLLVANTAMARVVSGGFYPSENHQDMRLGQAIALQVLRQALSEDNRSATLSFRDFDGRALRIVAHPRQFGRGLVELRDAAGSLPWPQMAAPPAAHLTAVM
ncbi:bromoperoxidase [Tropicibacter oceani]|uniref:Bromoperoxidase n=1 Tax=Tropicibacter oceani TaxID=3058420 RepID=A0ABY8QLL0_9RHOB|nr:bromoperoxidase [Tropicibacter oceani]WGW05425.1 bromoperoxidase [Tropicibacter oceani]